MEPASPTHNLPGRVQSSMALDWWELTGARDRQPIYVHGSPVGCRIPAESMHGVALAENLHIWELGMSEDAKTR